jgi:hypothetical protein
MNRVGLPRGHPLEDHLGHKLLERAFMAVDVRQTDDAVQALGDAMRSFGWDTENRPYDRSPARRCWRAWLGVAARVRVRSYDYMERGPLAYSTDEQELLNELEELYVDVCDARRDEILGPVGRRRTRRRGTL